ncbi:hypothetical protein B0A48_09062 [Cryoendolithus antarcticus]|uniref:Ubiquitin 3 binding protein But2 C-terminal domain-containing protein n=1 Tax=Cryoendolithus antarcticus TaxID=1507870 RepID=A0A1V8T1V9_9PEZI|nr:hypothetical protein B0A48_09062 [Cryoendolithus antarcticus]
MLTSRSLPLLLAVSIASVLAAPLEERATDQPQLATFEDLGNDNSVKVCQDLNWPSFKTIQADLTGTINGTHAIRVPAPSYRFISKTKDLDSFDVTSFSLGCLDRGEGAVALGVAVGCKVIIKSVKQSSTTIIPFGTFDFKPALGGLLPSNMEKAQLSSAAELQSLVFMIDKADKIAGRSLLIDDLKHVNHVKSAVSRSRKGGDLMLTVDDQGASFDDITPPGKAIGTYQGLVWNFLACQNALLGAVDGIKPASSTNLAVSTAAKAVLSRPPGSGTGTSAQFTVTAFSFACAAKVTGKIGVGQNCELEVIGSRGLKIVGR